MKKIIVRIILVACIAVITVMATRTKPTVNPEVIHTELVSTYPVLKDNSYAKTHSVFANLETEATICDDQRVISYWVKPMKDPRSIGGDWRNISIVDCGATYYVYDVSDSGNKLFGPFEKALP